MIMLISNVISFFSNLYIFEFYILLLSYNTFYFTRVYYNSY